jgi:hypothetical protein
MIIRLRLLFVVLLTCLALVVPIRAVTTGRVTVTTSATLLYTAPTSGVCPNSPACRVLVRNPSTVSVYVGDSGVTTANGFEIAAGDALGINVRSGESLYGIVAAATQVVQTVTP